MLIWKVQVKEYMDGIYVRINDFDTYKCDTDKQAIDLALKIVRKSPLTFQWDYSTHTATRIYHD